MNELNQKYKNTIEVLEKLEEIKNDIEENKREYYEIVDNLGILNLVLIDMTKKYQKDLKNKAK